MSSSSSDCFRPPCVILKTTMGSVTVELYWDSAPKTCQNFVELAESGYYNGCIFHRIIKEFIVQGGDPTGTGKGGYSIYGQYFDDELSDTLRHEGAGVVAMANCGPNTNGSQFFITLATAQSLDGKDTIFGRVTDGLLVVKKIGMVSTDSSDRPTDEISILEAYAQTSLAL